MKETILGIDIGTSACKAAAFYLDGTLAAQAAAEYPVYYPRQGWAEQDPEEWWSAVCAALQKLFSPAGAELDPRSVIGVGVDGQSWSAVALDKKGDVLCNTPVWMDTRAEGICQRLRGEMEEAVFALCGNPLQPSYTLPKILWYREELPEIYKRVYQVLQSNSYINFRLTGEMTQDTSQGYGLHCFDMRQLKWDDTMCARFGIDPDLLPPIFPSHGIIGRVTPQAQAQTGLPAGIPVAAGGLDAACGTLGAGVIQPGQTQEQGGQAGGMSICIDGCRADPRLILGCHVVPDRWLLQGGTVGGGGVARWYLREFGAYEEQAARQSGKSPLYEMDKEAEAIPPGSDGLVFLPYMAGERSPIWDPNAKGVYYGLDFSKTRAHLIRAGLEGVAYSLRHNLETAEEAGARAGELRAMGGAANSRLWTQIKADVTGKRICVPASDTATTLGAALLAGVGIGAYSGFEEAVSRTVRISRVQDPDAGNQAVYEKSYRVYLELYQQLKGIMKRGGKGEDQV